MRRLGAAAAAVHVPAVVGALLVDVRVAVVVRAVPGLTAGADLQEISATALTCG